MQLETLFSDKTLKYTGRELRPHWIFEEFGLRGDAAVSWVGPCHVGLEDLVDIEDADAGAYISSDQMVHVIIEHFLFRDLLLGVHRQHILAAIAQQVIYEQSGIMPHRAGNDLFVDERKLSVSIATSSPVSTLIHFGVNVISTGAPIPVSCLTDLEIQPREFATALLEGYRDDISKMYAAVSKVRPR
ncbi:MAG: DUF366 family protein [Candidatus Brocadiia bacterium]